MLTLRPYQEKGLDDIRYALRKGMKSIVFVGPTGMGKTVLFATIAHGAVSRNSRVLILVHRREILEQTLKSLYDLGVTSGQIASGRPQTTDSVQTAMVMSLTRRLDYVRRPDLIIVDECFPAGTEIAGVGKIETVKIGDIVESFNEESGSIELRQVTQVFKRKHSENFIRLSAGGKKIICTSNHLIYAGSGWLEAKNLKKGMKVLIYGELQNMRIGDNRIEKNLFRRMLSERYFIKNGANEQKVCIKENDRKEPDAQKRNKGKSKSGAEKNRPQAEDTRRKWEAFTETTKIAFRKIARLWLFGRGNYSNKNAQGQRIPNLLQDRYCKQRNQIRYRDRRKLSLRSRQAGTGQEKDGFLGFRRVDNIEILKQGSNELAVGIFGNNYIYDLEIEGTHTYIANGIVVHNCHHALADNSWGRILKYWRDVPRIGFTATPERLDGRGLGESFDEMIEGPTVAELVNDGYLSYPVVYRPPEEVALNYHVKRGDFDAREQQQTMTTRKIIGDVIEHYKKHLNGLPAICFCVSVEHTKLMAEEFRAAGYRAAPVYGDMPDKNRNRALKGLADGLISIITSCDLISEGFDTPAVAGCILLRRTLSLGLYLQQCGRALRPAPGKTKAIILDHVGNYLLHGHVLDDRQWSLNSHARDPRKEKPPTTTTCPQCYGVWPGSPRICPDCGFRFSDVQREVKPLQVIAGELVEAIPGLAPEQAQGMAGFLAGTQRMNPDQRQKAMWSKALEMAHDGAPDARRRLDALRKALGYKAGWTAFVWREVMKRRA